MDSRSPTIDYLRAFAILWVILYHFCSISIFKTGFYGVVLFFAISGYCIAHSSATARTPWHFYAKRVGRLMPALVACSLATVAFKHLAPHLIEESRTLPWRDMIYGWFAMPTLNLPAADYRLPDGAYWSLLVEFRFYVLVFVIMLLGLRERLLLCVCIYTLLCVILIRQERDFDFYTFFIAGISVAELRAGRRLSGVLGLLFAFSLDIFFLLNHYTQSSAPIGVQRSIVLWISTAAIFVAASIRLDASVRRVLAPLAYIGLVSYPMYLIHQDAGRMALRFFGIEYSDMLVPRLISLIVVPAALILVAGAIHTFVEGPLIRPLTNLLTGDRKRSFDGMAAGIEDNGSHNEAVSVRAEQALIPLIRDRS